MNNPFQLTRAADLDDDQILKLWVDPSGYFGARLRPSSALPMIILGGRGSGKTHLLRYFSYPIQRQLHKPTEMASVVKKQGYIGIHSRCMGLNAGRFRGKQLDDEQWRTLFSYYLELWLGQMLLQTTISFLEDCGCLSEIDESAITEELCNLFDHPPILSSYTLSSFNDQLRHLQREIDHLVNNASFRKPVAPTIETSPGNLIFGIPKTLVKLVPEMKGIMFTLFVDEYEHLYEEQQKHFNTLIRERENPVSFKIGARLHGLKTHKTWGGDEELREGSDYELLNLDAELRKNEEAYETFAKRLCVSRIKFSLGGILPEDWTDDEAVERFARCFAAGPGLESAIADKLNSRDVDSPWLQGLEKHLSKMSSSLEGLGVKSVLDRSKIVDDLRCRDSPLVEKTSCFLFYQAWSGRVDLLRAAFEISNSAKAYLAGSKRTLHGRRLNHFKKDLIAQMISELGLKDLGLTDYIGLSSWIQMSHGIARNLITTLKNVFDWAIWRQEALYLEGGISVASQVKGVTDSAIWFLADANVLGEAAANVSPGMKRACHLLKELRFSEKIPECSLCTFTVDSDSTDDQTMKVIEAAEQWSLLIRTTDRRDRNSGAHLVAYRINGMIAPDYLLPVSSRGNIHLSKDEAFAIFGSKEDTKFLMIFKQRISRCLPPFSRGKTLPSTPDSTSSDELGLF